MTQEILQAICSAEEKAVAMKTVALERSEKILLEAENKTQEIERENLNSCKAFLEASQNEARTKAQEQFDEMIKTKTQEAKEYCAEALKGADVLVSEIVRRLVSGNC
jgi:vacuolar-type H+-ATPase subunit H